MTENREAKGQTPEQDLICRECGKHFESLKDLDNHELRTGHDPYGMGC